MSLFTLVLVGIAFSYICDSTKATDKDDDFLQIINLANSPSNSPKSYAPIQEQQKQQQYEQQTQVQKQQSKRSTIMTLRARHKRSQHDLNKMEEHSKGIPAYAYYQALLNIMQTLRKQISKIELALLSSHLSRSTAADLQLLNEIYKNNNNAATYNDERTPLNDDEVDNVNNNDGASYIGTDTGNGGFEKFDGVGGVGGDIGPTAIAGKGMLVNGIESASEPWQFLARTSKKSSPLYRPRLGKRTHQQEQQQEYQ
ncbi:uncharacterized protein [Eurosta solidaginis]|uniref:uncharacterized protein n=1 Tax=Eurosta solidaginis TaxID=178769 RepID=UPI0035314E50